VQTNNNSNGYSLKDFKLIDNANGSWPDNCFYLVEEGVIIVTVSGLTVVLILGSQLVF
jgi:hypothetical protein